MTREAFINSMSACLFLSAGVATADPAIGSAGTSAIDWRGLYSGVYLGGGGANRYSIAGGVGQESDGNMQRATSGIATVALASGYNFQIGHAVIGIENDLNLMRPVGDRTQTSLASPRRHFRPASIKRQRIRGIVCRLRSASRLAMRSIERSSRAPAG